MSNRSRTSRNYEENAIVAITAHVDGARSYTTTAVEMKGFAGLGVAKRNHQDPVDFDLGRQLSLARALRDLADNIEKELRP